MTGSEVKSRISIRGPSHFLGSTGLFPVAVNAIVAGVLGALVTDACGANGFVTALIGGGCLVRMPWCSSA